MSALGRRRDTASSSFAQPSPAFEHAVSQQVQQLSDATTNAFSSAVILTKLERSARFKTARSAKRLVEIERLLQLPTTGVPEALQTTEDPASTSLSRGAPQASGSQDLSMRNESKTADADSSDPFEACENIALTAPSRPKAAELMALVLVPHLSSFSSPENIRKVRSFLKDFFNGPFMSLVTFSASTSEARLWSLPEWRCLGECVEAVSRALMGDSNSAGLPYDLFFCEQIEPFVLRAVSGLMSPPDVEFVDVVSKVTALARAHPALKESLIAMVGAKFSLELVSEVLD